MIPQNIAEKAIEACKHAVAYDTELRKCAGDPEKMESFCTARGETLDLLYWRWFQGARDVLEELEKQKKR